MKKFFSYFSVLVIGLAVGYELGEQQHRGGPRHPGAVMNFLYEAAGEMDIEPERAQKLQAIFIQSRDEIQEVGKDVWPKLKEIRKRTKKQVREILTEEERKDLRKRVKEKREKARAERKKRWKDG